MIMPSSLVSVVEPVRRSVTVHVPVERAFEIFTADFDTWWPRSHHIGKAPLKKAIVEGRAGGRCYSLQIDGTECDWGSVLLWEPPHRFVMAWQIDTRWEYEPDLAKSSEVEVRFSPEPDGSTRIDLEHRAFERHGENAASMQAGVGSPNGWRGILDLYARRAGQDSLGGAQ
jgi:uncharacterized protein YndB with AHSA1/START domain